MHVHVAVGRRRDVGVVLVHWVGFAAPATVVGVGHGGILSCLVVVLLDENLVLDA